MQAVLSTVLENGGYWEATFASNTVSDPDSRKPTSGGFHLIPACPKDGIHFNPLAALLRHIAPRRAGS